MRRTKLSLLLVAAFLVAAYALHRSPRFTRAQAVSSSPQKQGGTAADLPKKTYTLFAGIWRVDGDFVSTIHIKNSLVVGPIEVTPVLYMADGTGYSLPTVTLATAGVAVVNVNQALTQAQPRIAKHLSQYGSVALRYRYSGPGHVLASIQLLNIPESLSFTYSFNDVREGASGPQMVEGLWWRRDPDVGGFVSIANVTDEPLEVGVQSIGSRGTAAAEEELQIAGHAAQMLDLDELTADLPGLENQAGGIRVQYVGKPGAIVVAGGLVNEREGYSANMPFCPGWDGVFGPR